MENASKALLMAGGMLMAIIIMSLIVMAWNNMRELPKTQEQIQEAKELAEFNKKYESYAKNGVRGTDIVTVVNMANSNNKKYEGQSDMQITVKFEIKKPVDKVIRTYEKEDNNEKWNLTVTTKNGSIKGLYDNTNFDNNIKEFFQIVSDDNAQNVTYYALSEYDLDDDTKRTTSSSKIIEMAKEKGKDCYYTKDNIGAEFRRKKFNCTDVKYNENGRIREIDFVEQ